LNNREENRQFRAALQEIRRQLGRRLMKEEQERLHRKISRRGFGFHEIIQIGLAMFT
jgi:SOS response regulatory protein OraA/RecX